VVSNPQGILFNPLSIAKCLQRIVSSDRFSEDELVLDSIDKDVYHSWQHGREFSGRDKVQVVKKMNEALFYSHEHLSKSKCLFITLGTSIAYKHKETNTFVSNCHKQPSTQFDKLQLSITEIVSNLEVAVQTVKSLNPSIHVVITVSPVRHTREGLVENSLSKSTLICAAHELTKNIQNVAYFPSYEIIIDEFRDYRWFGEDMIHLNDIAKDLIFLKFSETFFSPETKILANNILQIEKDLKHRPIVRDCKAYERHIKNVVSKINNLRSATKELNLNYETEMIFCESKLASFDK